MTLRLIKTGTSIAVHYEDTPRWREYLRSTLDEYTEMQSFYDRREGRMKSTVKEYWFRDEPKRKRCFFPIMAEGVLRTELEWQNIPHEVIEVPAIEPVTFKNIEFADTFMYRPRQEGYVDFLVNFEKPIRVLPATMGAGKTTCTIATIGLLGVAGMVAIPPSLRDEWLGTTKKVLKVTDDDHFYISGSDALNAYYEMCKENGGTPYLITFISNNTLQGFLNGYDEKYTFTPEEFFETCRFGVRAADEADVAQHFHMVTGFYANVKSNLFLTATLMKEDPFAAKMENGLYPAVSRCPVPEPSNHVCLRSYMYEIGPKIPNHVGPKGYSHAIFETALMRKKRSLNSYLDMIMAILNRDFLKVREEGDRALVFFSQTKMADLFQAVLEKYLKEQGSSLKAVRYKAGDAKKVLNGADIVVCTLRKAGRGTDLPGLVYVLQTVAVSSIAENYQNVGRLRLLTEKDTVFGYTWSCSLPKHREYHQKRQRGLTPLIHKRETIRYPKPVTYGMAA